MMLMEPNTKKCGADIKACYVWGSVVCACLVVSTTYYLLDIDIIPIPTVLGLFGIAFGANLAINVPIPALPALGLSIGRAAFIVLVGTIGAALLGLLYVFIGFLYFFNCVTAIFGLQLFIILCIWDWLFFSAIASKKFGEPLDQRNLGPRKSERSWVTVIAIYLVFVFGMNIYSLGVSGHAWASAWTNNRIADGLNVSID